MKTLLVPVDLSAATFRVSDAAAAFARQVKARLVLMHAVQPQPVLPADLYAFDSTVVAGVLEAEQKLAARKLKTLARRYAGKKLPVQTLLVTGEPAAEILAAAAGYKADYIVIGSHGHGVAYDLLIGSAAQGVLRKASCPVLVIPIKRK